jgi:hypothetical protein
VLKRGVDGADDPEDIIRKDIKEEQAPSSPAYRRSTRTNPCIALCGHSHLLGLSSLLKNEFCSFGSAERDSVVPPSQRNRIRFSTAN